MENTKIRARIIVEVIGSPKEHVENILTKVENILKKEQNVKVVECTKFEVKETKNKFWGGFLEAEIVTESLDKLIHFCFDYTPSSIEILEPEEFKIKCNNFTDLLNDFLTNMHRHIMFIRNLEAELYIRKKKLGEIK